MTQVIGPISQGEYGMAFEARKNDYIRTIESPRGKLAPRARNSPPTHKTQLPHTKVVTSHVAQTPQPLLGGIFRPSLG